MTDVPRIVAKLRTFFPGVDRVADSTKPVKVKVTAADCKRGERKEGDACAMARALKRDMDLDGVLVWRSTAWLVKGSTAIKYAVPERLAREIVAFDRGAEFMPGEYALAQVPKSASIADRERKRRNTKAGGESYGKSRKPEMIRRRTEGVRISEGKK